MVTRGRHLLRLLIKTNTYNEIAEEFREGTIRIFPDTPQDLRKRSEKCTRDSITEDMQYSDPYAARWEQIKNMQAEYMMEAEHLSFGLVENPTERF